ncbi:hypothetical protein Ddye_025300 [Dipteronia dyeriana]|uniref:Uncharacterized protein n=1 Tax=Dipteronia dyeriana TaxID=168575 RepID=A0AAD9TWK8_9ROSI|nr:hypothetical protein Ddye_025300 [Dipteronia dyeriana]
MSKFFHSFEDSRCFCKDVKKLKDGKVAPLQPLTTIMQRVHIGRLIERYGDKYQAMFMDTKLNAIQLSISNLE